MIKQNVASILNDELLKQPFSIDKVESAILSEYQQIAYGYSKIENSIAVLSDLKSDKSYIYNGGFAEILGIAEKNSSKIIDSIWEEDIFSRIHPDDLAKKHLLELQFFHLLKTISVDERSDYQIVSKMQMKDQSDKYIPTQHRMFYVSSCPSGNLWLALCLYNYSYEHPDYEVSNGTIINSATGNTIEADKNNCDNILSSREKEILLLIEKGRMSKDIATALSISINTVNRHRQNILEKLRVKNSLEACRVAKLMKLF